GRGAGAIGCASFQPERIAGTTFGSISGPSPPIGEPRAAWRHPQSCARTGRRKNFPASPGSTGPPFSRNRPPGPPAAEKPPGPPAAGRPPGPPADGLLLRLPAGGL